MNNIIDDFELKKTTIYNNFVEYFENPIMTKIKDVNIYSMYISKIDCNLSTYKRYLIILVLKDNILVGNTQFLNQLNWNCLQTRELQETYDIKPHFYVPKKITKLNCSIIKENDTDGGSEYTCFDLPLKVTLLHINKKKDYYEFPHKGSLVAAIETYKTVITLI